MTVESLAEKLELTVRSQPDEIREINGCYIGDLLSWVMSKAEAGNVWLTIMGNANVIAVAQLSDVACVVVCEDAPIDEQALEHAKFNGIGVYSTEKTSYEMALEIGKFLAEPS